MKIQEKFSAEITSVRSICHKVERKLQMWRLTENDLTDIMISIDEAITNIIVHGYSTGDKEKKIKIEIEKSPESVEVVIIDKGISFNPDDVPRPDIVENVKCGKKGGFGVFLMKSLMDKVMCQRRQNCNIMRMIKKVQSV